MDDNAVWLSAEDLPKDLEGKTIQVDVHARSKDGTRGYVGIGVVRVVANPAGDGTCCAWVMYTLPRGRQKTAMDEIDLHNLKPHPDPSIADYLCSGQYVA